MSCYTTIQLICSMSRSLTCCSMLHHSNVDRLWAYWQAIRPSDSTFRVSYTGGSRFATAGGTKISPDSPLQPFLKPGGGFHTSRSVNSLQGFGYSYRGLEYWQKSPDQMRQDATQIINSLYSPTYSKLQNQSLRADSTTRYFARVSVDVTQLERPCEVNILVGGVRAASMVVMNQPAIGVASGLFPLDNAVKSSDVRSGAADQAFDLVKSKMQVEIIKVRMLHHYTWHLVLLTLSHIARRLTYSHLVSFQSQGRL